MARDLILKEGYWKNGKSKSMKHLTEDEKKAICGFNAVGATFVRTSKPDTPYNINQLTECARCVDFYRRRR